MAKNRRSGTLFVKADGLVLEVIGNWTCNDGVPKKETLAGADQIHGYKEMPVPAYIEGEIRDSADLDIKAIKELEDATITAEMANGKTFVLRNAWYAADGDLGTEEANLQFRFEGKSGEYV